MEEQDGIRGQVEILRRAGVNPCDVAIHRLVESVGPCMACKEPSMHDVIVCDGENRAVFLCLCSTHARSFWNLWNPSGEPLANQLIPC